jgi:endogenous inhibitor of DNA gyrase (YacG/DUF329 family)
MPADDKPRGGTGHRSDARPPRMPGDGKPCPVCGRPAVARFRPFCSRRCADVDLFRWLGGTYRIPTPEEPDSEGGDGSPEPD